MSAKTTIRTPGFKAEYPPRGIDRLVVGRLAAMLLMAAGHLGPADAGLNQWNLSFFSKLIFRLLSLR
jgi:hypothetical protein